MTQMQMQPSEAVKSYAHWPKTGLRVGFGVIWLIDATLKWLPGFQLNYMDTIMGQASGQPGWVKPWLDFWTNIEHPYATVFAYVVAVLETVIAVGLIVGFARKLTYIGAIVLSVLIWGTAEGFGGPYSSGASDIGTALIYALVFAALLMFGYYYGPAPWSVDVLLERWISWWHWVAEVGHHERYTAQSSHHSAPGSAAQPPLVHRHSAQRTA